MGFVLAAVPRGTLCKRIRFLRKSIPRLIWWRMEISRTISAMRIGVCILRPIMPMRFKDGSPMMSSKSVMVESTPTSWHHNASSNSPQTRTPASNKTSPTCPSVSFISWPSHGPPGKTGHLPIASLRFSSAVMKSASTQQRTTKSRRWALTWEHR